MTWGEYLGIIVPIIALFGFLYRELKDWRKETRDEISEIRKEAGEIRKETAEQSRRSDRLYEMFIDLLKAHKPKKNP